MTDAPVNSQIKPEKPSSKPKRPTLDWMVAPDGASIAQNFHLESPEAAVNFARTALRLALKIELPIGVDWDKSAVTIRLAAAGGKADRNARVLARRLTKRMEQANAGEPGDGDADEVLADDGS